MISFYAARNETLSRQLLLVHLRRLNLVANVAANLVAFIALVEFLNQTLIWFGNRAGMEKPDKELTFQVKHIKNHSIFTDNYNFVCRIQHLIWKKLSALSFYCTEMCC